MILEQINKYLTHINIIDTINTIGKMNMDEVVEKLSNSTEEEKDRVLSVLDEDIAKEVRKLIDGGVL